jgi:oligopeptide/dipeptide ABC transporter ATP-binding protein
MSGVLLSARNLSVAFGAERVVENLALDIAPGEIVGLMGEPGCGKSIAALAMLGLVRNGARIESGSVAFEGRDLLAMPDDERRAHRGRDIGLVVQNPRAALHPLLPVGAQIAAIFRAHKGGTEAEAESAAIKMLTRLGIADPERRMRAYAHELSTGMAQRVLIAMALVAGPRLLIADEPTSGLDVTIQAQLLDDLWDTARATGTGLLLVTRDLGLIANYCDRLLVMARGRIVEASAVKDFFAGPKTEYGARVLHLQRTALETPKPKPVTVAPQPLVDVTNLGKIFTVGGKALHAVDDVSFSIQPGECLGLIGESGSGKSTIGRCLLRLLEPSAGNLRYRGQDLRATEGSALTQLRARMQIVFQDPLEAMNPRFTVGEVVEEPLLLHASLARPERRTRVEALLAQVGVAATFIDEKPKTLSAGQQQAVAIARALATDPDFLVLDEPTSSLTPEATAELLTLLRKLSAERNLAYLFISHDLTTVGAICHRVAVLYLGRVVELGTTAQVFGSPNHPYAKALLAAHLAPDVADRRVDRAVRQSLKGEIPSPIDRPPGCALAGRCPQELPRCRTDAQILSPLSDGRTVRCWRAGEQALAAE